MKKIHVVIEPESEYNDRRIHSVFQSNKDADDFCRKYEYEEVETHNIYIDDRPLTDETLEELGFEKGGYKKSWWIYRDFPYSDLLAYLIDNESSKYEVYIGDLNKPIYKTVGSIRRLIEALKGDE